MGTLPRLRGGTVAIWSYRMTNFSSYVGVGAAGAQQAYDEFFVISWRKRGGEAAV